MLKKEMIQAISGLSLFARWSVIGLVVSAAVYFPLRDTVDRLTLQLARVEAEVKKFETEKLNEADLKQGYQFIARKFPAKEEEGLRQLSDKRVRFEEPLAEAVAS